MSQYLRGQKIAVLVANGFSEKDLTLTQKEILSFGAQIRIVSMDAGLVSSWNDDEGQGIWGLNFASDQVLSRALAADFDVLLVPGGQRSLDKLKMTAHTRRFIRSFVEAGKAVIFFHDALELLAFAECGGGVRVSGPEGVRETLEAQGAIWVDDEMVQSGAVMSGRCDEDTRGDFTAAVAQFLMEQASAGAMSQAVAA
ncbi:MAG: DJ-1/PfpI family protein [Rhodospirillales bacterium]|nr:DJ-1/PfpI family protein [Alphaproteobacteria bacterium]MCB9981365.1 DJ-1/PfpI family protein [Rhodospirillales bacterium]